MIFYFSGSGNSHYAANTIAKKLDIPLVSMTACLKSSKLDFDARKEKYCGFVFPVHFWGVPYLVTKFIRNIQIKLSSDTYVFAVYTCGGGAGNTSKMIEKLLKKSGITLSSVFSVKQVDIFVPFFKIPPKDKREELILKSNVELENITTHIQNLDKGDFDENKGSLPFLATALLYPVYSYYRNTSKFRVSDLCTACKKCESICPLKIIEIKDNKPIWKQKKCTLCFACLHICPAQAINYGKVLFSTTVKIKADIETLMHLKAINIFIIIIFLLFTACAEGNNQNNSINNDSTKYDFVYNEPGVIYTTAGNYNTGNIEKNTLIENITLSFNNVRNEEVYSLIPESDENKANSVSFFISNAETKCSPLAECSITFNMLIKEQSPFNDSLTVYLLSACYPFKPAGNEYFYRDECRRKI